MLPAGLLYGSLLTRTPPLPLLLAVRLADLRGRFLAKGRIGKGYRAVARNGRVLLASDRPLAELSGQAARLRVQTWHRALLAGDRPEPYGVLLCVRTGLGTPATPLYGMRLVRCPGPAAVLALDVGGRTVLEFVPSGELGSANAQEVRTATSR